MQVWRTTGHKVWIINVLFVFYKSQSHCLLCPIKRHFNSKNNTTPFTLVANMLSPLPYMINLLTLYSACPVLSCVSLTPSSSPSSPAPSSPPPAPLDSSPCPGPSQRPLAPAGGEGAAGGSCSEAWRRCDAG